MSESSDYDYRTTHLSASKSVGYHENFSSNPYRAMLWKHEREMLDQIIENQFGEDPIDYLDFACGTGRIIAHLRTRCNTAVGVDISQAMLNVAQEETNSKAELICGDLTREDLLQGRTFSLITAFRFFPNAQEELRRDALKALVALMKDDGFLVFNNHKNSSSLIYRLAKLFRTKRIGMSQAEVDAMLEAENLKIVSDKFTGIFLSTEKYRLLPVALIEKIERFLHRFPKLSKFASNRVFVVQKIGSSYSENSSSFQ